ncbi:hypothetical protein ACLBWX_23065 [Methylobacterium sp. M6A4_1b]
MSKPPFLPSPRPRPHTSPEDARQLAAATRDLGFTRASSAPQMPPAAARIFDEPQPAEATESVPAAPTKARASTRRPKAAVLKIEVPDPVWTALRQEALDRRVTVKYLVLEALAAKGYAFDLSAIPKDGRRLR